MKNLISNTLTALAFLLMLPGCYTQQKAARQMDKARRMQPAVAESRCADWYPIQRFDSVRQEYIPGKPAPPQSIQIDCDSVMKALAGQDKNPDRNADKNTDKKPGVISIPCPPCPGTDTVRYTRTVVQENTARIAELQTRVRDAELKANTATTKLAGARRWNWILGIAAGLLAAAHIFLFARKIKP